MRILPPYSTNNIAGNPNRMYSSGGDPQSSGGSVIGGLVGWAGGWVTMGATASCTVAVNEGTSVAGSAGVSEGCGEGVLLDGAVTAGRGDGLIGGSTVPGSTGRAEGPEPGGR